MRERLDPDVDLTRRQAVGLAGLGLAGALGIDTFRGAGGAEVSGPDGRPDTSDEAVDAYARGCTAFGLDLLSELPDDEPNAMVSPLGLSSALAMTWAGARGETERRMAEGCHFPLEQDRLHPAVGALQHDLDGRGRGVQHREFPQMWNVNRFSLGLANAFWGQTGYPFADAFRETLAENYGADLREVDFESSPEAARRRINDWGKRASDGRVDELLAPGTVTGFTKFALTNAVALRADWQQPFDPDDTERGEFTRPDGSTVDVPLMHQEGQFTLLREYPDDTEAGVGYRAVELPYVGGDVSMVLVVPEHDRSLAELERAIDAAWLESRFADLDDRGPGEAMVTMPKFSFANEFELGETLEGMGMTTAFDAKAADFGGMTDPADAADGLHLSHVVQDTYVAVDEEGTVAVAISASLGDQVSGHPSITLNRPFLFCIRDRPTDAVLFLGRVTDPSVNS